MRWLYFILTHSIFIAICAVALTVQAYILAGQKVDFYYLAFVFIATFSAYNLYWLWSKFWYAFNKSLKELLRVEWSKLTIVVLGLCFSFLIALKIQLPFGVICLAVLLFLLYSTNVLLLPRFFGSADFRYLKPVFLAMVWAMITANLPLQKFPINVLFGYVFYFNFFFVFLLCLIFDKRDAEQDKLRGLPSIMTQWPKWAIQLTVVITFLFKILLLALMAKNSSENIVVLGPTLGSLFALILWWQSNKRRDYLFYYFFVDGAMLFSALCTLLFDNI